MPLAKTVLDIRALKIQGAEAISKAALRALAEVVHSSRASTKLVFLRELSVAKAQLENARATEPCLRNTLDFVFRRSSGEIISELRESYLQNIQTVLSELERAEQQVYQSGALKITNGMVVFTHCHSSTVMGVLKTAKAQGRQFVVHNTETRPHLQGRKTAEELASKGIKVTHFVDAAARLALKKADLMLIGCDAFTSEGKVINKIGSELFAEIAQKLQIPVYVCTTTWKFDPKTVFGFEEMIEKRDKKDVWDKAPRNVTVDNHAFEMVSPELVAGMITELGVFKPEVLVEELRSRRTWINN